MTVTGMRTGLRANARLASVEGIEGSSLTVTYLFCLLVREVTLGKCHTAYARKSLTWQEIYSSQIGISGKRAHLFRFNSLTSIVSQAADSTRDAGIQSSVS